MCHSRRSSGWTDNIHHGSILLVTQSEVSVRELARNQNPGTSSPEWNAAVVSVKNSPCAFPALTSQNVCQEKWFIVLVIETEGVPKQSAVERCSSECVAIVKTNTHKKNMDAVTVRWNEGWNSIKCTRRHSNELGAGMASRWAVADRPKWISLHDDDAEWECSSQWV